MIAHNFYFWIIIGSHYNTQYRFSCSSCGAILSGWSLSTFGSLGARENLAWDECTHIIRLKSLAESVNSSSTLLFKQQYTQSMVGFPTGSFAGEELAGNCLMTRHVHRTRTCMHASVNLRKKAVVDDGSLAAISSPLQLLVILNPQLKNYGNTESLCATDGTLRCYNLYL